MSDAHVAASHKPSAVAKELGISMITMWRWLREGKMPAIKVGSRYFIPDQALRQFMRSERKSA